MLRNYFKIACRNLWNNKLFSSINIISLAIGFSASFVIGIMVYYDMTFDKFHEDSELIYRIPTDFSSKDGEFHNSGVAIGLINKVRTDISGIESAAGIHVESSFLQVKVEESQKIFKKPDFMAYTDPEFFEIFKYNWIAGTPHRSLKDPNKIVLTDQRAKKYFPYLKYNEMVGQTLIYNDSILITVSGIVENFQQRTDLQFQEFISMGTAKNTRPSLLDDSWNSTSSGNQLFVKVTDQSVLPSLRKSLTQLGEEHRTDFDKQYGRKRNFILQPLSDIHFNQDYGIFNFSGRRANLSVMTGLGFVAVFLLLLGCINFINLNTAQANQRAKEIGIRKTLGSSRKQLVMQFLGETFILTLSAAAVSVVLAYYLLEVFKDFISEGLQFSIFQEPLIIISAAILIIVVTLLSGIYPALVLSHYKPVSVLKNQVIDQAGKPTLRKFLTVFQFSIAQIFIIATILVGRQIHFMMNSDMGFSTESLVNVATPWYIDSFDKKLRLVEELNKIPSISGAVLAGDPPASFNSSTNITTVHIGDEEIQSPLQLLHGDEKFIELYDIEILAGRPILNDTIHEFVVNESYVRALGLKNPEEALGILIEMNSEKNPIVGVVKDFNQRSLKLPIDPLAIIGDWKRSEYSGFGTVHFKLPKAKASISAALAEVEEVYKDIYPSADFTINFMDESVGEFYNQEKSLSKLLNWAMGLSVLISCLGLVGLVIYTTERRTKEIGIRKILGASLSQLNLLLCKDFIILVGIAFLIAAPIAYWGLSNWLQDFAFKTEMSWWIFVVSGLGMLSIALIIMSTRTIRTAMKNPVDSLRTE